MNQRSSKSICKHHPNKSDQVTSLRSAAVLERWAKTNIAIHPTRE
jgi:hypothetical protein